jgi:hypothetical protein
VITFASFTSSSLDIDITIPFAKDTATGIGMEERYSVIFEIEVNEHGNLNEIKDEKIKDLAKKQSNQKVRPMKVEKFSKYPYEKEVLFAPLSTFKINSLPKLERHHSGLKYQLIKLKYLDTFVSTN